MSKTTRVEAINKSFFDSVLLSKTTRIDANNKSWFVSVLMSKKTRVLPWGDIRKFLVIPKRSILSENNVYNMNFKLNIYYPNQY